MGPRQIRGGSQIGLGADPVRLPCVQRWTGSNDAARFGGSGPSTSETIPGGREKTAAETSGIAMSATTPRLEKFYSRLNIEDADIILHFGMGSAECIDLLCSRAKKRARIIIFEPDEILRRRSGGGPSNAPSDPRLQFVTGASVADFFGNWGLGVYDDTDRFLWIESPELSPRHLMIAESLKKQFQSHLRDRAANLLTHFRNGQKYFENAIGNFDFQSDANAGELFGRFANVPLVIVAAGPSLDRT